MKIGVCKTCAKKHNCKTAQNVAKLIETDMVDIFISPAFQKHIVFFCWIKRKTVGLIHILLQNVCKMFANITDYCSPGFQLS